MGIALCQPACATLSAETICFAQCWARGSCCPCRATGISGCLITLGQTCISLAAGRPVDSPVQFALVKALSQEAVFQNLTSRMGLAVSAFETPVAHELLWALAPPLLSHFHLLIPAFPIPRAAEYLHANKMFLNHKMLA